MLILLVDGVCVFLLNMQCDKICDWVNVCYGFNVVLWVMLIQIVFIGFVEGGGFVQMGFVEEQVGFVIVFCRLCNLDL